MAKFAQRTEAPSADNTYYYANNPFYKSGYGLPNCTCYAFGRFWEVKGGDIPSLSWGNAEEWYGHTSDGYERGQTPKLGAVICWRKGVAGDSSDGAGHVEVVEAINEDGTIITSGSAYNGFMFRRKTRANDGNWGGGSAYTLQGFIYNPVTFDGSGSTVGRSNSETIWNYFITRIGNPYGVAGLLGNLDAESGLWPDRVEGDVPYSSFSKEYTAKVDSGEVTEDEFVNGGPDGYGPGYGLAQWTYYTRKQGLYDMYKNGRYTSIGSMELACDYLWHELQTSFPDVVEVLKNATSVREASDKVLHDFEAPEDQSEDVEKLRSNMCQVYYDMYGPGIRKTRKALPLWMMYLATKRKV